MRELIKYQWNAGGKTWQSHAAHSFQHAPIPVWSPRALTPSSSSSFQDFYSGNSTPRTTLQVQTVLQTQTALQAIPPRPRRRRTRSVYLGLWLFVLPFINACVLVGLLVYLILGQKADGAPVTVPSQPIWQPATQPQGSSSLESSPALADGTAEKSPGDAAAIAAHLAWPVLQVTDLETATHSTVQPQVAPLPPIPGEATGRFVHPAVGFPISSGFGQRQHPIAKQMRFHGGLDFATPIGTPIRAADGGQVTLAQPKGGYGNLVEIDHGNGFRTRYAHLEVLRVQVGDRVVQQEMIGLSGNTGYSTGPHLHFEVHFKGEPQDPYPYLFD